jgi:hypothetical protein
MYGENKINNDLLLIKLIFVLSNKNLERGRRVVYSGGRQFKSSDDHIYFFLFF